MRNIISFFLLVFAFIIHTGRSQTFALHQTWQYVPMGTNLGGTGFVATDIDGDGSTEIVLADANTTFGGNTGWHILRYSSSSSNYQTIFSEASQHGYITAIIGADVDTDGLTEILIAYSDGTIEARDPVTREILLTATVSYSPATLLAGDFDNDGTDEIAVSADGRTELFSLAFIHELTINYGYDSIAVGNVDDDATLETVMGNGQVLEVVGTAVTMQWNKGTPFGVIGLADSDGDGVDEIIAAHSWSTIHGFDVRLEATEWTLSTSHDIHCILLQDIDSDGVKELFYGDAQWGAIHCIDIETRTSRWSIPNPEHGVTNIVVSDLDNDGSDEIMWGAGQTSTGEDFLFIHDLATRAFEWQSLDLDTPITDVAYGDVDGDGDLEIVGLTYESNSGYGNGRLLVFDATTHDLEWVSPNNLFTGSLWTGAHTLAIGDVDGDTQQEIVVGSDDLYDGTIYVIDAARGVQEAEYTLEDGSPIYEVAIADVDGDGDQEIIAGGGVEHTGSDGLRVSVLDGATGAVEYQSPIFASYWQDSYAMKTVDWDGDGDLEIFVTCFGEDVFLIDPSPGFVQNQNLSDILALEVGDWDGDGVPEFFAGNTSGEVLIYDRDGLKETLNLGTSSVYSIILADADSDAVPDLVVAFDGKLAVYSRASGELWSSQEIASNLGYYNSMLFADYNQNGYPELLAGSSIGMHEFSLPPASIQLTGNGFGITDGDETPNMTDGTAFGLVSAGDSVTHTFRVHNPGAFDMDLTGSPIVSVTGSTAFAVSSFPATTIGPFSYSDFNVTFTPADSGTQTAVISIANSSTDHNPYEFTVTGEPITGPYLSISRDTIDVACDIGVSPADETFSITNLGPGTLTYSVTESSDWLSLSPASGTSTGEDDPITISFDTAALVSGLHSATITVTSDGDNSPQTVLVRLTVAPPEIFPPGGAMPPGWVQSSGSNANWEVSGTAFSEGELSLKSSTISHSQTAAIEFSGIFFDGNVTFTYKVSSESCCDRLRFYIDGAEQGNWGGNVDWTTATIPISAGAHTVKWVYSKDGSVNTGSDCAWIDEVVLPAGNVMANADSYHTEPDTTLTVSAPGVLQNDLDMDGDPLTAILVGNPAHGVLTLNADGSFEYIPDSAYSGLDSFTYKATDTVNESNTVTVNLGINLEIFPAGGVMPSDWVKPSDSTAGWEVSQTEHSEGYFSLKSSTISHSQTAAVEYSGFFYGGNVTFKYKVSSESCCDKLRFYIDGVQQGYWGGNVDWTAASYPIPLGEHTVKWVYSKDGSVNTGSDCAWIDEVFLPTGNVGALEDTYITAPDTTLIVPAAGVLENDVDREGDPLSAILISNTTNGVVALNSDGSFVYIPQAGYAGDDSFSYKATDGNNESNTVSVTIHVYDEIFPANGEVPVGWVQPPGADAGWEPSLADHSEGYYSLSPVDISHNQSAEIEYTDIFTDGFVLFNYKVSTQSNYDFLRFYIDDVEQVAWSGNFGWTFVAIPITGGEHTIKWQYSKNNSYDGGLDSVWIDEVSLPIDRLTIEAEAWASPDTLPISESTVLGVVVGSVNALAVTYTWDKFSGPGDVIFTSNGDASSFITSATFTQPGPHVLRVTADNGLQSVVSYVAVNVLSIQSVLYDGNGSTGGTVPSDTTDYTSGATTVVLSAGSMTRKGHRFKGWNTAADGSGTAYYAGDTMVVGTTDVTLYAQWKRSKPSVGCALGNGSDTNAYLPIALLLLALLWLRRPECLRLGRAKTGR